MTIVIKKNTSAKEFDKIIKEAKKNKTNSKKGFDARKYCGTIKSFENIDPMKLQKEWRDEWK